MLSHNGGQTGGNLRAREGLYYSIKVSSFKSQMAILKENPPKCKTFKIQRQTRTVIL